ncbi:EamA family transporter [Faecalispora anaeroviscerum]|uniref:EamA family transporter n=1 Tax=Faecalispora anaeroviscerum TaxID=2991836 RepID=UPI0024B8E948|nr:EamA family transporter [Faecalispora anaeroviscerum]
MWNYIWPILMVIAANSLYHVCAKSTPATVEPLAALTVTYLTATACSLILFFLVGGNKNLLQEVHKVNWTSFTLGLSIVILELGYLFVYRAGWKVGMGSLVANVGLACVLLVIGLVFYKESFSARQLVGMGICVLGIFLITK